MPPKIERTPASVEELSNEALDLRLRQTQEHLASHLESMRKIESRLGRLSIAEMQRQQGIYDLADLVGHRITIDTHAESPRKTTLNEEGALLEHEDPIRTSGGILANNIIDPIREKVSEIYSVHSDNPERKTEQERPQIDFSKEETGKLTKIRGVFSARRIEKQKQRQQKAARRDRVTGANVGQGKTAKLGTKIARGKEMLDAATDLQKGNISPDEAYSKIRNRKDIRKVKDSSRDIRREQRGAAKALLASEQPISSPIRRWRIARLETKLEGKEKQFRTLNQERIRLMLEQDHRQEEQDTNE